MADSFPPGRASDSYKNRAVGPRPPIASMPPSGGPGAPGSGPLPPSLGPIGAPGRGPSPVPPVNPGIQPPPPQFVPPTNPTTPALGGKTNPVTPPGNPAQLPWQHFMPMVQHLTSLYPQGFVGGNAGNGGGTPGNTSGI